MKTLIEALRALLAHEKHALLSGNYDHLETLTAEKQQLVQALGSHDMPQATLETLRHSLAQNAALLASAAQGIQDARHLLVRLHGGQDTLMYDRHGTSRTMKAIKYQLERKA